MNARLIQVAIVILCDLTEVDFGLINLALEASTA
ncbi:hypothetical protein Psta_2617 [Pirellula staleyi DSM 6068]|uniref:Uncharacterized protein n=1 Tax=Pirellula staleyi (strain ATCC 27377 / DSM 6068 / ICPB 4128) TaxID=530564 RepID=D2R6I6_PIRSD|nr:hypothetical protein Psta_2617 [Pirellula staleyi DSM 6068]